MSDELAEGLTAYADEHADMETSIADMFEAKWAVVRDKAYAYLNNEGGGSSSQPQPQQVEVVQVEIEVASEVEESGSEDEER